jgi:hypothetical protein
VLITRVLLKARGRQRTDSTHVLASIRLLNRLECVGETLRQALNAPAVAAPDWLRSWVPTTAKIALRGHGSANQPKALGSARHSEPSADVIRDEPPARR